MKPLFLLLILGLLLCGCGAVAENPPVTDPAPPETTGVLPLPETTVPETTAPLHSPLFLPGVTAEDACLYFREVCLAAEFVHSGDPSVLQRWETPLSVLIQGTPTQEDLVTLRAFFYDLNLLEGFPGIAETTAPAAANLRFYFCDQEEMLRLMGSDYGGLDGAVTFWYENNAIYDAIICVRTDLDQTVRNSVILEELYNGLGPIQDTSLRTDSIIWAEFSAPQSLTETDTLILKLLYHPDMKCGMDAAQCDAVIHSLYY